MLSAGTRLGAYEIVSLLGTGGMGEVYRARDPRLGREVAVKVLSATPEQTANGARLLREARVVAALNHQNICTIHDVGQADGLAYIAMELVEGRPLSERLRQHGALPSAEVHAYALQLADAIAHAHARGVVHGDLKSANVMITGDLHCADAVVARRVRLAAADREPVPAKGTVGEISARH